MTANRNRRRPSRLGPSALRRPPLHLPYGTNNPKACLLTDTGMSGINGSVWYDWGAPNVTSTASGFGVPSFTSSTYTGMNSLGHYDLTDSYLIMQLTSAGDQSATDIPSWEVFSCELLFDANNYVNFRVSQGILSARKSVAGSPSDFVTAAYNASTHQWLRIRESLGQTLWETSLDGATWNSFAVAANPFAMTALQVQFVAGTYATETLTTSATWANINLPTAAGPAPAQATALNPSVASTVNAANAVATASAVSPTATVSPNAGGASAAASALSPGITVSASPGVAAVVASAFSPSTTHTANAGVASAVASAFNPTVSTAFIANAGLAASAILGFNASTVIGQSAAAASAMAAAFNATVHIAATYHPDPRRTWIIAAESRGSIVAKESRTVAVAAEKRSAAVAPESRIVTVAAEARRYLVTS